MQQREDFQAPNDLLFAAHTGTGFFLLGGWFCLGRWLAVCFAKLVGGLLRETALLFLPILLRWAFPLFGGEDICPIIGVTGWRAVAIFLRSQVGTTTNLIDGSHRFVT